MTPIDCGSARSLDISQYAIHASSLSPSQTINGLSCSKDRHDAPYVFYVEGASTASPIQPYYAARMGAPSVPPGRYFRMHLVGYFEGIDSDGLTRELFRESICHARAVGHDSTGSWR